ncbi:MAG: hypothetical protein WBF33_27420 [Candidatus Nitrosopolaris sp.]
MFLAVFAINNTAEHTNEVLLAANDNLFNGTNPDIIATVNVPEKIVALNKDFVRHDFIVDKLNINTAYLFSEQSFTTAITSKAAGTFEYYCSFPAK